MHTLCRRYSIVPGVYNNSDIEKDTNLYRDTPQLCLDLCTLPGMLPTSRNVDIAGDPKGFDEDQSLWREALTLALAEGSRAATTACSHPAKKSSSLSLSLFLSLSLSFSLSLSHSLSLSLARSRSISLFLSRSFLSPPLCPSAAPLLRRLM